MSVENELSAEIDSRPIVVFDIDGVLFETPDDAVAASNTEHGTSYSTSDIFNYNAEHDKEKFVVDGVDQFWKFQLNTARYRKVEDAREGLQRLHDAGVKIVALTSRNYDMFYDITVAAIKEHFGDLVDEVLFSTEPLTGAHKEKGKIVKELGGKALVDDAVKYLESAEAHGIPGILLEKDYNRLGHSFPPEKTAKDFMQAVDMILGKLAEES